MRYGIVELTQGNINNGHLCLASAMNLFPADSIGGSSYAECAKRLLKVYYGIGEPAITDIAGDKKIFRKRDWEKKFFKAHDLKEGDFVVIERTGPDCYHVYPARTGKS